MANYIDDRKWKWKPCGMGAKIKTVYIYLELPEERQEEIINVCSRTIERCQMKIILCYAENTQTGHFSHLITSISLFQRTCMATDQRFNL